MSSESRLSNKDLQLLDRFLDGALSGAELQACRHRLETEPAFRKELQQRRGLRRGFEAGRETAFEPSPDFAASVVMAARRLPVVDAEGDSAGSATLCRRILIAAALVLAATILWHSELFHDGGEDTLQASPDEVQRTIDELDARIRMDVDGTEPK